MPRKILLSINCGQRCWTQLADLYVTPREERIKTLCLFFLTPLAGAVAFWLLDLDSDLYTAAMVKESQASDLFKTQSNAQNHRRL